MKRMVSVLLTLALLLGFFPGAFSPSAEASGSSEAEVFYKIAFLDCGRKYFSAEEIEAWMDNAAEGGFSHVMLAVGNDGLRFLLDDMSLDLDASGTFSLAAVEEEAKEEDGGIGYISFEEGEPTENEEIAMQSEETLAEEEFQPLAVAEEPALLTVGRSYDSDSVKAALHAGNEKYSNFPVDELTQSEMDSLIAYAKARNLEVIPTINTPGHMDAVVSAMKTLGIANPGYSGSVRTVDVSNSDALDFTRALLEKYMAYFAAQGCTLFNLGCDEYANDVYPNGGMGFGNLVSTRKYGAFVDYVNSLAAVSKAYGMTPMAFNDGIYYNNRTDFGTFDPDIIVLYWSSGWTNYNVNSAANLKALGHRLINVHGDYYWVLGKSDWQCSPTKAAGFNVNAFQGGSISDPVGAMFCIWCDYPQADTGANVVSKTRSTMLAFGSAMPADPNAPRTGTTKNNPFPKGTAGSNSFRIPSLVTLSDGTLVAAADARWNTTYDGGGLDTMVSVSRDGGKLWHWCFANYMGDNGDVYNGSSSSCFIDPAMAVTAGDTVYLLCDLYPYGVALNGSGSTAPSTESAFRADGSLKLKKSGESEYNYYLSGDTIYSASGTAVSGYTVDEHFNVYANGSSAPTSNLFYKNAPYQVVRTAYLYLISSRDGGESWSAPTLLNLKTTAEQACLVAPGAALVTSCGTIVFPVYSYNGSEASQRLSFLYSSDGVNWQRSPALDYSWASESAVVELEDGTLRFFFRNNSKRICYADATAGADGWVWGSSVTTSVAVNSNTQLSAIRYSKLVDGKSAVLISCPAGGSGGSNSSDSSARINGKILVGLVNEDGSMNFKYSMAVKSLNSSNTFLYSCLTETADGSIALLYEDGQGSWGAGSNCYVAMSFARYTMSDIAPGAVLSTEFFGRAEQCFNADWRFSLGFGSANPADDDSGWQIVSVPHDYSITQSFTTSGESESGFLPGGTGWYRKHFTLPADYAGAELSINFDGVYSDATVYLNGRYVGEHHYGYSPFALDLTDAAVCDGKTDNILAVKVENNQPNSRWYSGSGIIRDVTLMVTNPLHIAQNGVAVTTPGIASGDGTAETRVELRNDSGRAQEVTVTNTVYLGDAAVASSGQTLTLDAHSSGLAELASPVVEAPLLWSIDSPTQYTMVTELSVNGKTVDSVQNHFGYRWYTFDGSGFHLNGRNVKLNGVCLHHDQGALGAASYTEAMCRQLSKLRDMGVNAIRTSHNPADKDFIALCSAMGFVVMEEAFDTWTQPKNGNTNDFSQWFVRSIGADNGLLDAAAGETWAEFVIRSMVRRDRNEPAVILWSLGNEITEGISGSAAAYPSIAENLITWVEAEDITRPTTLGDNQKGGNATVNSVLSVIHSHGGVAGFNYANATQLQSLYNRYGALISSETSSAVNSRAMYQGTASNSAVDGSMHLTSYDTSAVSWGTTAHQSIYNTYTADYVSGEFVWTGFDYIGEPTPYISTRPGSVSGKGAMPNSSYFGIIDTAGFEKDSYYLYRSQWNKSSNTLHLVTAWDGDNMTTTNGLTPVDIYSNAAKVELYRDGVLVGTATRSVNTTPAGYSYYTYTTVSNNASLCTAVSASGSEQLYASFRLRFTPGTLSAKAYDELGNDITAACAGTSSITTPGSAAKLILMDNDSPDGALSYVEIRVTDADGNLDTAAKNLLNISVENGFIYGVDNGDQATTQKFQQPSAKLSYNQAQIAAYGGKALVIVSAGSRVTATSNGLTRGTYSPDGVEPTPDPIGFVSGSQLVQELSRSADMGKILTLTLSGIPAWATPSISSSEENIAQASLEGSTLTITTGMDGTADITVTVEETVLTAHLTVRRNYTNCQSVSLPLGESTTLTDNSGNYQSAYTAALLDASIAAVTVRGTTEPGTPATAARTTKLNSFAAGSYVLGANGGYLVKNGSSLTTTTNPENATRWQLSGSANSLTISSGGSYLSHSTSGISLSASAANASWKFSGGRFQFQTSSRFLFWTTTTTYYLTLNGVSTSTGSTASAYTVTPGTPAVPGRSYTTITLQGLADGETHVLVGSTLYDIRVHAPLPRQTVTVKSEDDVGASVAAEYTISGVIGTAYTVTPAAISNYTTPAPVQGVYTEGADTITLVYVLNTDKTALANELNNVTPRGDYTAESYNVYTDALAAGQAVYNRRAMQSEVNNAVTAIRNAKAKLEKTAAYTLDTDGINSGSEYLLLSGSRALAVVNGKLTTVTVTVSSNGVSAVDNSAVWVLRSSGSGYTIQNKQSGKYLGYSSSGLFFSYKLTPNVGSSATVWKLSQSGSNLRIYISSGWSSYYLNVSSVSMSTGSANIAAYRKNT